MGKPCFQIALLLQVFSLFQMKQPQLGMEFSAVTNLESYFSPHLLTQFQNLHFQQALDGRCSLAAAHVSYVQSLKNTGTALRKFIEPEAPLESSLYTSTNATPEPLALTEKSISHFSISSRSLSHPVDATENLSPSPSPPSSSRFQANYMKFRGFSSKKVEEAPPVVVTGTVTSSSTPQNITPRSTEKPESSPFEASSVPPGTPPWDYFGLFSSN